MDPRLRVIAVGGSLVVFAFVVELVRRRRLKEEYSVLWIVTALVLILLAAWNGLLNQASSLIGAASSQNTLFFFGLMFVVLMLLHFSVRISAMERRITSLVQELGLLTLKPAQPTRDVEEPLDRDVPAEAREHVGASALAESGAQRRVSE
jgi:hypothetical protein